LISEPFELFDVANVNDFFEYQKTPFNTYRFLKKESVNDSQQQNSLIALNKSIATRYLAAVEIVFRRSSVCRNQDCLKFAFSFK